MGESTRGSIRSFNPPIPQTPPLEQHSVSPLKYSSSMTLTGDGFTSSEIETTFWVKPPELWQPVSVYADHKIRDIRPGHGAVTFMGRVAGIYDTTQYPKTPQSAKGCVKLCVKDDTHAITCTVSLAQDVPESHDSDLT
nr:hypothetical protein CFP56_44417 [Quercus suber]